MLSNIKTNFFLQLLAEIYNHILSLDLFEGKPSKLCHEEKLQAN
jgi:hypothetical protein